MTTTKIAINGFGRIGRLVSRILIEKFPNVEIVAVNDLTSPENLAYLFQYDSTYRKFPHPVSVEGQNIVITTPNKVHTIQVLSEKDPANLPWKALEIDYVLECTGRFLTKELASLHLQAGAKKVILSAPAKDDSIATIVRGVNTLDQDEAIFSNASCTTNCISPALKVLQDKFGIQIANGITVHAYTATQVLQDGPSQKEFRDGRAAGVNMVPSKTGAAKAVVKIIPELKGKLGLSAIRVPVITGSMVYLTATLDKSVSLEELNQAFKDSAENELKEILEYSTEDLVSSDIIQNPHSTIFDSGLSEVNQNTIKVVLWYDNEWGYANRLAEVSSGLL